MPEHFLESKPAYIISHSIEALLKILQSIKTLQNNPAQISPSKKKFSFGYAIALRFIQDLNRFCSASQKSPMRNELLTKQLTPYKKQIAIQSTLSSWKENIIFCLCEKLSALSILSPKGSKRIWSRDPINSKIFWLWQVVSFKMSRYSTCTQENQKKIRNSYGMQNFMIQLTRIALKQGMEKHRNQSLGPNLPLLALPVPQCLLKCLEQDKRIRKSCNFIRILPRDLSLDQLIQNPLLQLEEKKAMNIKPLQRSRTELKQQIPIEKNQKLLITVKVLISKWLYENKSKRIIEIPDSSSEAQPTTSFKERSHQIQQKKMIQVSCQEKDTISPRIPFSDLIQDSFRKKNPRQGLVRKSQRIRNSQNSNANQVKFKNASSNSHFASDNFRQQKNSPFSRERPQISEAKRKFGNRKVLRKNGLGSLRPESRKQVCVQGQQAQLKKQKNRKGTKNPTILGLSGIDFDENERHNGRRKSRQVIKFEAKQKGKTRKGTITHANKQEIQEQLQMDERQDQQICEFVLSEKEYQTNYQMMGQLRRQFFKVREQHSNFCGKNENSVFFINQGFISVRENARFQQFLVQLREKHGIFARTDPFNLDLNLTHAGNEKISQLDRLYNFQSEEAWIKNRFSSCQRSSNRSTIDSEAYFIQKSIGPATDI